MSQVTSRRWRVDYGEPLLVGEISTSVLSCAMPLTWLSRRSNSLFLFFPSSHTAHGTDHESQGAIACPTPAPFTSFLTSTFVHRFDSLRCAHIGSICWLFVRLFMLRHDLFVCLISPFGRLQFVSLSSLDQTDLISNVTGDRGEAMAGGLW